MPENEIATVSADPASFRSFDTPLGELTTEFVALQNREKVDGKVTRMTVTLFQDWDVRAKRYLEDAEQSPQKKTVQKAWDVARDLSAWFKKATDPVSTARSWAGTHIFGAWDQQEKARVAQEQREREEAARKQQEEDRKADVEALKAAGHKEEARELKKAPLPPVALPPAKEAVKVQGRTTIEVYTFKNIFDAKQVVKYLADHPEDLIALFEPRLTEFKRRATAAKGTWNVPGVNFEKKTETRNRG
jgi:hypothetical protein